MARQIGARLDLPVVHLDLLYWNDKWQKSDLATFRAKTIESLNADRWICEGNYTKQTFDLRLHRADVIIWLDTPRSVCCFRIIKRVLSKRRRPDLPAGCRETIDIEFMRFIWHSWKFDLSVRPGIEADVHYQQNSSKIVRLRTQEDIKRFLSSLRSA